MSKIQILIVEDEPIVAEDIAGRLQKMGYWVAGMVESGEAAIATAANTQPDLVLMDIVLEGTMDGIEAAQRIRDLLNIPVVYLTANADETTLQRAKATIPFGYILKPFKTRELQATIEIALSRHQAEVEVQKALKAAQSSQRQVDEDQTRQTQYLLMAAHELRTPLSIVKFSASMIRERGYEMPEADRRRNLAYIETAVGSMNQLIEDVLTLGGLGINKTEFNPAPLNIAEFCEETVQSMQWGLGDQYSLQFSAQGDCADAWVDGKLLWHLLNNLLSNAIKYSPQGTTIALAVTCNPETIQIQIRDQGIGIPPEDQRNLFEPFQRGKNVGSVPGTGLGLAIAKCSVDLHGGTIAVESEMGQGTTITVILPTRAAANPATSRQE